MFSIYYLLLTNYDKIVAGLLTNKFRKGVKKIRKIFFVGIIALLLSLQPFHAISEVIAQDKTDNEETEYKKAIIVTDDEETLVPLYEDNPLETIDTKVLIKLHKDTEVTILKELENFSYIQLIENEIEYEGYIENIYLEIITPDNETIQQPEKEEKTTEQPSTNKKLGSSSTQSIAESNQNTNTLTSFSITATNSSASQETLQGIALKDKTYVYKQQNRNNGYYKAYNQGTLLKFKTLNANWYEARVKVNNKWYTGYIHQSDVEIPVTKQQTLQGIALQKTTKVYKLASTKAAAWKSYSQGTILKYKTFTSNWYQATVKINGKWQTGYIHKSHVENADQKQTTLQGIALKSPTRVYKNASTSSGTWKSYTQGSVLKYKTFSKNWYQATVKVSGKWRTGYIHKSHVDNLVSKPQTQYGLALKSPTRAYSAPGRNATVLKSYKVGSNLKYQTFSQNWHKATVIINGKKRTAYFHKNDVGERRIVTYNVSLSKALNAQMAVHPKTQYSEMYVPKTALKQVQENGKKVWKVNGQNIPVRNKPNSTAKIIGTIDERYVKDTITVRSSHGNYYRFSTWIIATKEDTLKYLNPNRYKQNDFIFLKLNRSTGVSASEVNNKILKGKGILQGKANAFISASKQHNINEIYLISHAFLETGYGTSALANGIEVGIDKNGKHVVVTSSNRSSLKNIKKTYNMFGIGAADSCNPNPHDCGAIRAYQEGWFSPDAAIIGGAKYIAERYIHKGQDTLYKMRWNPDAIAKDGVAKNQYATDIAWAEKQSNIIKQHYSQLNSYSLTFEIPQYK